MVRRVALWGGGVLLVALLCASAAVLLASPGVASAAGQRLPANLSSALADTPVPFMMAECASYPLWERWACASRPVTVIGGASTSGAACVASVPQWRVERELLAQQRGQPTELACAR